MPIYVDQTVDYGHQYGKFGRMTGKWCHMAADATDDLEKLHEFAAGIGLKRSWFQDRPRLPHYDLTPKKRRLAIERGAISIGPQEFILMCKREED